MKNIEEHIKDLLKEDPYKLDKDVKKKKFLSILKLQIQHHIQNCHKYKLWYKKNNFIKPEKIKEFNQIIQSSEN